MSKFCELAERAAHSEGTKPEQAPQAPVSLDFSLLKTNKSFTYTLEHDQATSLNTIHQRHSHEQRRNSAPRFYTNKLRGFFSRIFGQVRTPTRTTQPTKATPNQAPSKLSEDARYKLRTQFSTASSISHNDNTNRKHVPNNDLDKHDFVHAKLSSALSSASNAQLSTTVLSSSPKESNDDVDCGYAWVILAIIFVINASTFGTARAYGLIFDKLAREDDQERSTAALPFTIMGAVENMGGPLSGYLLSKTSSWRTMVFTGSCMITMSHLLAALSENLISQIVTIGLMCGIGLSFVSISFFQINNAYFVRYRSTAFGFGLTGAAFGTMYISPLCHHVLDNYSTSACYLMLGLLLLPNVPLSLLLKSKATADRVSLDAMPELKREILTKTASLSSSLMMVQSGYQTGQPTRPQEKVAVCTITGKLELDQKQQQTAGQCIKRVLSNPMFHLIWPTQLMFCWLNFVFGMIIVDFGQDKKLEEDQLSQLVPIWAFGQLVGRIVLGSLVDLKLISNRLYTVICFSFISISIWSMAHVKCEQQYNQFICIALLVFMLSTFISNLYILLNGLVTHYMDKSLTALSLGISSFAGSFFLLPRAHVIGYYRDTEGSYDSMLTMFTYASLVAALIWLFVPTFIVMYDSKFKENYLHKTLNLYLSNLAKYNQMTLSSHPPALTIITASET